MDAVTRWNDGPSAPESSSSQVGSAQAATLLRRDTLAEGSPIKLTRCPLACRAAIAAAVHAAMEELEKYLEIQKKNRVRTAELNCRLDVFLDEIQESPDVS